MKSFTKILSTALLLTAATTWSDQAIAATTAVTTLAQELTDVPLLIKFHKPLTTDIFVAPTVTSQTSATFYDNAYTGTATTTGTNYNLAVDSNYYVNALLSNGTSSTVGWESYQSAAIPSSSSATFTLACPQTYLDGVSTTTNTLNIVFTAGSGAGALLQATIASYLNTVTTTTLAASSSASTALTSTVSLGTGWTAKAYVVNGSSTAIARILAPASCNLSIPVTPSGSSSATTFTTTLSLSALQGFNTTPITSTTATRTISLTSAGGDSISLPVRPALMTRSSDIVTSLLAALNTGLPTSRRIYQSTSLFGASLHEGLTNIRAMRTIGGTTDLQGYDNAQILAALGKTATTQADLNTAGATTVSTDYNFATTASSAISVSSIGVITNPTGLTAGNYVTITGTVGASGSSKAFYSQRLEGMGTVGKITPTINPIQQFTSLDGDAAWMVMFNTSTSNTGLDATSLVSGATLQSEILAAEFANLLGTTIGLTTIPSVKYEALIAASQ